jgi:hypothetical protein
MSRHRWMVVMVGIALVATLGSAARADMRTKTVRLVPEKAWTASKGPLHVTHATALTDPKAVEFSERMDDWMVKAFEHLKYQVAAEAPVVVHIDIDRFDFGSQAKRLITGFGGKGLVVGTLVIKQGDQEVGRYRFSSHLSGGFMGGSVDAMAKEVGPPLVLKLDKGEVDDALHEGATEGATDAAPDEAAPAASPAPH